MRRNIAILFILVLTTAACAPTEMAYRRHLLRFTRADKSALLVLIPDKVVLSRSYDTGHEISIESRETPAALSPIAGDMAIKMADVLRKALPFLRINAVGECGSYLFETPRDPRLPGGSGYRLARAWTPPTPPNKRDWKESAVVVAPPLPLDDPRFTKIVYVSTAPFNNKSRTLYRILDAEKLRGAPDFRYALVVELAGVNIDLNGDDFDVGMTFETRVISLEDGLIVFEDTFETHGENLDAMTGVDLSGAAKVEDILADGGRLIRDAISAAAEPLAARIAERLQSAH